MALAESERAQVITVGEGITRMREPTRGRGALTKLLRDLDGIQPRGGTDLAKAIDGVILRSDRPGMLIVISDFLDPGPFTQAITRAAASGHDVALVQVLATEELAPPYDGDIAFEDAESGEVVEVTVDPGALDAYMQRLSGLFAMLRTTAKRHRATYVRASNAEPLLNAVRKLVSRAVD
jgi:uncharacterized protein (DUF58 family)